MRAFIDKFSIDNRFSFYAPFFRVFISLYLLKDIILMWEYYGLIYKGNSFLTPTSSPIMSYLGFSTDVLRDNFEVFYFIYFTLILFFLFGIGKRLTTILLFISLELIQNLAWVTLNGGDNLLKFALLYFIFVDSYSRFSIKPLSFKNNNTKKFNNFISNIAGYSLCIHFCIVYLVSALHKINADVWFNGVATYYILGSERFQGTPWNEVLVKNGFVVTVTTYTTILIEMSFPFLVWFKRTKYISLILSLSLHIGIAVFMMLYDFQIFFILVLGFFLCNKEWEALTNLASVRVGKIRSILKKHKLNKI